MALPCDEARLAVEGPAVVPQGSEARFRLRLADKGGEGG
jgi:hypothetical protein